MSGRILGILDSLSDIAGDLVRRGVPESTALKIASGELPMDQASRSSRALDQGYDLNSPQFHGTSSEFVNSQPSSVGNLGSGFYTTPDTDYAGSRSMVAKFKKGVDLNAGQNIIPMVTREGNYLDLNEAHVPNQYSSPDSQQALVDHGFDGIRRSIGDELIETNTFDPSNVRSLYAAFDPDQKTSRNMLASASGIGLLGATGSEDAEAGPLTAGARRLIDSRFSSAVGGGNERKGVLEAVETMQTGVDPRLMDTGLQRNLYDFEGSPYILTQSDRSAAGGILDSIHGKAIDPVDLRGGRDFMFDPSSQGQVWASDPGVVNSLHKRASELKKEFGQDPLILPYTMAPTGIDFSTMPLDTMINYARQGMSKTNIKKLDRQIKAVIPEWGGISDPASNAIFGQVKGPARKKIADIIDKSYRDVNGGLSISEARAATTDAGQYMEAEGTLKNIGRIDSSAGLIAESGHPTYRGGLPGEGIGTLAESINARPLMENNGRVLANDMSDIRALSMNHGLSQGVIDEKLLKRVYGQADPKLLGAMALGTGGAGVAAPAAKGLFDSIGDTALETMSGVNRAVADGVNFLTSDQINAILNLSGSDKRIPDLYDIPGIEGGTQGNYMEPGLLRQIVRQGSEFLSPI